MNRKIKKQLQVISDKCGIPVESLFPAHYSDDDIEMSVRLHDIMRVGKSHPKYEALRTALAQAAGR